MSPGKPFRLATKLVGAPKRALNASILRFFHSISQRIRPLQPKDAVRETAAAHEVARPVQQPVNEAATKGRFDWGSFSAFEDGSIEVEIAGIKRRFRDFFALKSSFRQSSPDAPSPPIPLMPCYQPLTHRFPHFESWKLGGQQFFLPVGIKQAWPKWPLPGGSQ